MATYTTYDQVGKAEDVRTSSLISLRPIAPCTPRSGAKKSPHREWQEDSLAAADNKAQVEGADASMATLSATTLRPTTRQIMTKAFQVSATADAIKTYGRAKETAFRLVA